VVIEVPDVDMPVLGEFLQGWVYSDSVYQVVCDKV
jgi:hypothetical protein